MGQTAQNKSNIFRQNSGQPYFASAWPNGDRPSSRIVTITGSGFGPGPNVVLFDRFVAPNGSVISPARAADIGAWKGYGFSDGVGVPRIFKANGRFWMANRDTTQLGSSSRNALGMFWYQNTYFTEFRYAKRLLVPNGYYAPGATTANTWTSFSSWKTSWFADIDGGNAFYGDSESDNSVHDLCIPTHVGSGSIQVDGNTTHPRYFDVDSVNGNAEFMSASLSTESMFSRYQNGNESSLGAHDAKVEAQWFTGGNVNTYSWVQSAPFRVSSGAQPNTGYRSFRENGWFGSGSDYSNNLGLHSDVYLAVGANSRACIYLTANTAFSGATPTPYIIPPLSWTDTQITCRVYDYELALGKFHIQPAAGSIIQNVSWSMS